MDDIILASTNMNKINSVKAFLDSKLKNKDLGFKITRSRKSLRENMLLIFSLMLVF